MTARWGFYAQWVWANAWSELVGFGAAFVLGFVLFGGLNDVSPSVIIGGAFFAVGAGAFLEGGVVGYAQARVLARRLPLSSSTWIWATIIGVGAAWLLGMVPSTVFALAAAQSGAVPSIGPGSAVTLALAAAMGLLLGAVLSTPQYAALKKHVLRAGLWIAANAGAWAVGMVAVFAAMGSLPSDAGGLRIGTTLAACGLVAGAIVGLIHGLVLLRLLDRQGAFAAD